MLTDVQKKGIGKIGLIGLSVLIVMLVVSNIYVYTSLQNQVTTITTERNDLQSQLNSLNAQFNSLNETYQNYVATHSHTDSAYDFLDTAYQDYIAEHTHNDSEYNALDLLYQDYMATHSCTNSEYDSLNAWYQANVAGRMYVSRDPTYAEVLSLMSKDVIHFSTYTQNYTCENFAADFKHEAFEAGYECGFVIITFPGSAHALDCFNTTLGLIFVEPETDTIVKLTIGQPYWDRTIYLPPPYDDTIISYLIVW
jgi:hypothetical protein